MTTPTEHLIIHYRRDIPGDQVGRAAAEVRGLLEQGWTVKAVSTCDSHTLFVMQEPKK